jgi:alpha-glucosidase
VVWDETRVLSGRVGDWIAVARRKGDEWYVAAMTDGSERELELDLSFVEPGPCTAEVFSDGPNAHRFAEDFRRENRTLDTSDPIRIHLAPGGGWVARLTHGG